MIRTDHFKHFFVCFMVSALGTILYQDHVSKLLKRDFEVISR